MESYQWWFLSYLIYTLYFVIFCVSVFCKQFQSMGGDDDDDIWVSIVVVGGGVSG